MTHHSDAPATPALDTPAGGVSVDEMPPYGEPRNRWWWVLLAGLAIVFAVLAFAVLRRLWRRWRRVVLAYRVPDRERDAEMIILPDQESYQGVVYRVRFYDGVYPQLTNVDMDVILDLRQPAARAQLADVARDLQRRVELRDGQRCWQPRLELLNGAGEVVGEWP